MLAGITNALCPCIPFEAGVFLQRFLRAYKGKVTSRRLQHIPALLRLLSGCCYVFMSFFVAVCLDFCIFWFFETVLLHRPGWPPSLDPPVSVSQVLSGVLHLLCLTVRIQ